MSEKRFEAKIDELSGCVCVYDRHYSTVQPYHGFQPSYPGGPQAAAEAEAARLNAWWEAEQAKKAWRITTGDPWVINAAGTVQIACYEVRRGRCFDGPLAARVCRLLNEDEARTK